MKNETIEERRERIEKIYTVKKEREYETRKHLFLSGDLSNISDIPLICIKELRDNLINELTEDILKEINIFIEKREQEIKQKQLKFKRNKKKEEYPLKEDYGKYGASGAYALMMAGIK